MKYLKTFESYEINEIFGFSKEEKESKKAKSIEKFNSDPKIKIDAVAKGEAYVKANGKAKIYNLTVKTHGKEAGQKYLIFNGLNPGIKYSVWNKDEIAPDGTKGYFVDSTKRGEVGANQ